MATRSVKFGLSSDAADGHGTAHGDHRRFGDGTLWSIGGAEVVDIVQQPTPPIPIFRHDSPRHGGRVAVMFLLEGEVQVTHGGSHFQFLAGSAAYIVTGTETLVEASERCRALIVSVTGDELRAAGVELNATFGAFATSTARTSPLLTFTQVLIEVIALHPIPSEPTATVLRELVAGVFRADSAYSASSIGSGLDLEFGGYRKTVRDFLLGQIDSGSPL